MHAFMYVYDFLELQSPYVDPQIVSPLLHGNPLNPHPVIHPVNALEHPMGEQR